MMDNLFLMTSWLGGALWHRQALGFNLLNQRRPPQKDPKKIMHASYIQCELVVDDFSHGWKLA
jgi:type VI protein secretion system component VasF